jgi:hypothetical protein
MMNERDQIVTAGKQEAQRIWEAEHPLSHGCSGKTSSTNKATLSAIRRAPQL